MASTIKPNDNKPQSRYSIEILWMKRVQEKVARGEYVDGEWLANALRNGDEHPISKGVLDYLCRFLDGKIEAPKGAQTDTSLS